MTSPVRREAIRNSLALAAAAYAEKMRNERATLIEEIEFMRDSGESPKRIAARLGYSKPTSLERRLERAGRPDLAAMFRPVYRDRHRSGRPCKAGCGGTCTRHSRYQVCRPCADRHGLQVALPASADPDALLARIARKAAA